MRHRAEFFFPDRLRGLGIPHRVVDQRPGETVVVLPDAYHEGFSCGYSIAEARNYAGPGWDPDAGAYQPCRPSCRLATAIPAAYMRPLGRGEERVDLCAAYGDGDGDGDGDGSGQGAGAVEAAAEAGEQDGADGGMVHFGGRQGGTKMFKGVWMDGR
ncbi:hypothetical protein E4U41_004627 [Claviceps citrina]|nr:hypothetical protein E4U41_004627 [Claviceps citrina]